MSAVMPDFDSTVISLRKWTRGHDQHVRAAVELLIWHETWLRRRDFTSACVRRDDDETMWIRWDEAREFAVFVRYEGDRYPKATDPADLTLITEAAPGSGNAEG